MALTLEQRERRVIADTNKIRFFPFSVVRGEGAYLIGEDGRRITMRTLRTKGVKHDRSCHRGQGIGRAHRKIDPSRDDHDRRPEGDPGRDRCVP